MTAGIILVFTTGPLSANFASRIRPDYHRRLFPEIALAAELPLFPREAFRPMLPRGQDRTPGNTIRKVYLCRAKTKRLRPGNLLFFYMSKDPGYAASQSITTVGIVEQVQDVASADDLIRHTAKRSVFSAEELQEMKPSASSPVKMIDFLLVGHLEPIRLEALLSLSVFSGRPPQSIIQLSEEQYEKLKPYIQLGFEL